METVVWVVESDPTFGKHCQRILEQNGYAVRLFDKGLVAVQAFSEEFRNPGKCPEIILLNYDLSEMTGKDFCLRIRDIESNPDVSLILMASLEKSNELESKVKTHFGGNAFMPIPFAKEDLLQLVDALRDKMISADSQEEVIPIHGSRGAESHSHAFADKKKGHIRPSGLDIPQILGSLFEQQFSGTLNLQDEQLEKNVFFQQGKPIFADTSDPKERIGQVLIRKGWASKEQINSNLEIDKNPDLRLGQILMDQKIISSHQLFEAIQEQVKIIIQGLFAWDQGVFSYHHGPAADNEDIYLTMDPFVLVQQGITRYYSEKRILPRLKDGKIIFVPTETYGAVLKRLSLGPKEQKVAQLFLKNAMLIRHAEQSPLPRNATLQIFYTLYCLHAIATKT